MPKSRVTPASQSVSWNRVGSAPGVQALKLYVEEPGETTLFAHFSMQFIGAGVEWLAAPDVIDGYPTVIDGVADIYLLLQNVEQLENGTHQCNIYFDISNESGIIRSFSASVSLLLSGTIGPQITTDKNVYNVVFSRESNSLFGDLTVNVLNNSGGTSLQFDQQPPLVAPQSGFTDSFPLENDPANPLQDNTVLPASGAYILPCRLLGPGGQVFSSFSINMLVLSAQGIGISPSSLAFEVMKGGVEKTAVLHIENPLGKSYTLAAPAWLSLSSTSGDATSDVTVATDTSAVEPGSYNGDITLSASSGSLTVSVEIVVKQFIDVETGPDKFCLDIPPVSFTRISADARYVKIGLTAFFSVMGVQTQSSFDFIVPYINDKAQFELGKKLHGYFPRYRENLFGLQAKTEFIQAIEAGLVIEELDEKYDSLMTENVSGLKYFPGSRPARFPLMTNFGYRKKNHGSIIFVSNADDEKVYLEVENNADTLTEIERGGQKIFLYDLPKVFGTLHVQWENQNLVPEWFTFTGEYTITNDFTHITSKNVLTALQQKFESSKIKKLQINSGFMLDEELALLEEMISSPEAFIKISDIVYRCYNVTQKLTERNSADNLHERDLEFIIVEWK